MSIITFIVILIMGLGFLYIGASVFAHSCMFLAQMFHKHIGGPKTMDSAWAITKTITLRFIQFAKNNITQAKRQKPEPEIDLAFLEIPTYLRKGDEILF